MVIENQYLRISDFEGHSGSFWDVNLVLLLNLGGGYRDVFTL